MPWECMGERPFCLLMRFIALIKDSRIIFLPFVEDGTIILIGATTENPYFEVNGALLSRSIVFELKALEIPEIKDTDPAGSKR